MVLDGPCRSSHRAGATRPGSRCV